MSLEKKIEDKLTEWLVANDTETATTTCEHTVKMLARKIDDAGILSRMSKKDQLEFMAITTQMMAGSQAQTIKVVKKLKSLIDSDDEFGEFIKDLYYKNPKLDKYRKEWTR